MTMPQTRYSIFSGLLDPASARKRLIFQKPIYTRFILVLRTEFKVSVHHRRGWPERAKRHRCAKLALRAKQDRIANLMFKHGNNLAATRGVRPGAKALAELGAFAPRLLAVFAIACATALAACASRSTQQEAEPIEAPPVRRFDRALLTSQPAPDCEFRGADLKTMDPDVFARLKLDYERQCFQRAEKIARARLRVLQASNRCEVDPDRYSPSTLR